MLLEWRLRPSFLEVDARQCYGKAFASAAFSFVSVSVFCIRIAFASGPSTRSTHPGRHECNARELACRVTLGVMFQNLTPTQGGGSTTARCRAGGAPEKLGCTGPKLRCFFPHCHGPDCLVAAAPVRQRLWQLPEGSNLRTNRCSSPRTPCRHDLGSHPPHGPR